uniref:DNA-binding protein D-ETS-4 n=1 Tax=Thelazia callipaeda TaxID=103827 RepID=A0A0N5CVU4_THECL
LLSFSEIQNDNSACYLTTTQPSTASTEEAVVRLREDGTDDEISAAVATSLPNSTTTHTNDIAQMDIYRDLILRHLIQDINATCTKLGLPTDPQAWSAEHSARWMSEMCVQFQLPPPRQLYMNGRTLLSMTQDDFMVRAPEGGDTLHAQLQLWKTGKDSYDSYSQQGDHSSNSNSSHTSSQITQNCNCSPQYWMNPPSLALNAAEQGELLTSAQDYLNNFNPSSTDATANMNCYPNSAYQNISHGRSLVEGTTQQHYYAGAHNVGIGVLPSPSDSEISNDSSINDVNTVDAATVVDVRQTTTSRFARHSGSVHLWHFIRELLDHPKQYSSCVRWVDRQEGTFKIESSHHLARFWGQRKNRTQMNYDKLSRSLRQYYKKGIIQKPEKKQRLVYKFLPPYNL